MLLAKSASLLTKRINVTAPDFFLIGVTKSGTTTLYNMLNQHPRIFLSAHKEPNYFAIIEKEKLSSGAQTSLELFQPVLMWEEYQALFISAEEHQLCGEASSSYFYIEGTEGRIASRLPEARLILILRDPVERAFSHYLEYRALGLFQPGLSFQHFCEIELDLIDTPVIWEEHPQALRAGFYARHLARWRQVFPEKQMRIYLFEDLLLQPKKLLADIYEFIGLSGKHPIKKMEHKRKSGEPRVPWLQSFLTERKSSKDFLRKILPVPVRKLRYMLINANLRKPTMPVEMRKRLGKLYQEDILALESMLGRDLSIWKNK